MVLALHMADPDLNADIPYCPPGTAGNISVSESGLTPDHCQGFAPSAPYTKGILDYFYL